jgi:uncharacterized protein YcfJ
MNWKLRNALGVAAIAVATQAAAQVTFYEHENFGGRSFMAGYTISNFERSGFNDYASSVVVNQGRWEVCEDAHFEGRCMVLRPGTYPSLRAMGLNDSISSVREIGRDAGIEAHRYAPIAGAPPPAYDYVRRPSEAVYEAKVTSVHAVVGPPEQRCWIEREKVAQGRSDATIPGAIIGGVLGGVLGHQIGGGRGRDVATVGGAVGGAVIGGAIGSQHGDDRYVTQDVQRCTSASTPGNVAYWDVTYAFRGLEHRVQLTQPPGPTIAVNAEGEPRV